MYREFCASIFQFYFCAFAINFHTFENALMQDQRHKNQSLNRVSEVRLLLIFGRNGKFLCSKRLRTVNCAGVLYQQVFRRVLQFHRTTICTIMHTLCLVLSLYNRQGPKVYP